MNPQISGMANPNPVAKIENLTPFKKGHSGNPHGRAAEKVVKEFYECNDLQRLKELTLEMHKLAMGEDVEEVTEQEMPNGKILKKTRRWKEKSVAAYNALMMRGYGAPKQEVEVSGNISHAIADLFVEKNVTPTLDDQPNP